MSSIHRAIHGFIRNNLLLGRAYFPGSELLYPTGSLRDAAALTSGVQSMLTISKALSAGQAQTYHSREFASEQQNYWSRDRHAHSEWGGALAAEWDLRGPVRADHF